MRAIAATRFDRGGKTAIPDTIKVNGIGRFMLRRICSCLMQQRNRNEY